MDFGTDPGTMIISMIKYLQKIIEEFPETLRGTKAWIPYLISEKKRT